MVAPLSSDVWRGEFGLLIVGRWREGGRKKMVPFGAR